MKGKFSEKQIEKARNLVENDLVMQLDQDTFLVNSSSGDHSYEVQKIHDKPYDYYCKCKGWQFSRVVKVCIHCLAISMYLEHLKEDQN